MKSILFVCAGNTCRSPMAAAMARQLLGDKAVVASCGIETANNLTATIEAVEVMRERGIDLRSHRSKVVKEVDLSSYDLIYAMTSSIASVLSSHYSIARERIVVLDVSDPYGHGIEAYRRCADELGEKLYALIKS